MTGRARAWSVAAVLCGLFACAPVLGAQADPDLRPERRKPQFVKDFGYAVFPYPYRLPGIGSGVGLVGGAMNIADSHTDVYGIRFTGDVHGTALGVGDLHLVPRTLVVDAGYSNVSRVSLQSYSQRGMQSGKDDYRLLEIGDSEFYGARMTATFFERRFELYGAWYEGASQLKSVRDREGNLIVEASGAPRERGHTNLLGMRVDLTDDYADPRRGARLDLTGTRTPPRGLGADYYVTDYNASAYAPFGRRSTWVFNLLRSDAHVKRQGETDPLALQAEQGLSCGSIADAAQRRFCTEVFDNMAAENRHGTATSLGGFNRLRAYPQGRYKGAHTLFVGSEFRWNVTEERTPFDLVFMRDVRTSVQIAFFYETGVTSDDRAELYRRASWRDNYGIGLRIVTASGVVFRGDVGYGRDGPGAAIFIGYPWEI